MNNAFTLKKKKLFYHEVINCVFNIIYFVQVFVQTVEK